MAIWVFVLPAAVLSFSSVLGLGVPAKSPVLHNDGASLYHWTTGNLDVARSKSVEVGRDLILACTPPEDPWSGMDGCIWENPQGQNWFVDLHQNQVVDENRAPVEGVEVWGDAIFENTCGILVNGGVMDEGLMGDWSCKLRIQNFTLVGRISTEDVITTGVRLPETVVPKNYKIDLIPDLHTNQPIIKNHKVHFLGKVVIRLEFTKTTPVLKLHMDELTITEIIVNAVEDPTKAFTINKVGLDFQRTFIEIYLKDTQFQEGQAYDVLISFQADLVRPESSFNYGFYRMHHCNNGKACWFNLFAATYARNAFPCLDEPAMKATFDMRVARKEGWTALSNMPLEETEPMEGEEGWFWDKFFTTVVMSPYLVSVIVTDLVPLNSTDGNFSVWAPEIDVYSGRANYALEIGPRILRFYEDYFGVKYPLPKMDLASEKKKGTAMENWGLILFDPIYLLVDPLNTDPDIRWDVTNTVAHEIAHQWFGNLVTMNWWSQTWLNEGFATFVSYLGVEEVDPYSNPWGRFLADEIFKVMSADGNINHHKAMSDEVIDRDSIEDKFEEDYLYTYKKGGSVIRMMESILTRPTFTKGLKQYLSDLSYSTAVEEDLFMYLELSGKEDGTWPRGIEKSFEEVMKTWTNQAGLPIVNVERSCTNNNCSIYLSQSWYISKGETDEERNWDIPITLTTAGGIQDNWNTTTPSLWLTSENTQVTSLPVAHLTPAIPVVVNVQAVGYYRVNYDLDNWRLIASTLDSNRIQIHHFNRAQIICDIHHLEATGHVSTDTKNMVLQYIDKEDDYTALKAFHNCAKWAKYPHSTKDKIVRT